MDDARHIAYELKLDAREADQFVVLDFEVREGLSAGTTTVVRAASAAFFDGATLLGKDGTLTLSYGWDEPRFFHGVIVRCALQKTSSNDNLLEVELRSRISLLAFGRDNRIFVDSDARKVTEELLKKIKIPTDKQKWSLAKDPIARPHILQREESDLDLVQRLLAREGIGYAVHNTEKQEELVFFDDSTKLEPIAGVHVMRDRTATGTGTDIVFDVREQSRVRPDAVMMRDYNPLLPAAKMDVNFPADGNGTRQVYRHPGGYVDEAVGKRLAERTLDGLKVGGRSITGRCDCARLEPGRTFTIESHPREALNGDLLILDVVHRGHMSDSADGRVVAYECSFTAQPKTTQFRPLAEEPIRRGPELAFATVPDGEEIHCDPYGRNKARFPWDRSGKKNDKSSNWLRTGQLPLGGSMILPRDGFELLVDYELGEVDRPHILGHLYNGKSPPPYALPDGATVSSIQTNTTSGGGGANEIRFEDKQGAEEIFMNASKDYTLSVDNDALFQVVNNETAKVGVDSELLVGADYLANVAANRTLQVGATQGVNVGGNFSQNVGANLQVQVGAMRKVQCGGDHSEVTVGTLTRTVGALQSVTGLKGVMRNVVGDSQVTVGAAWMEVVARSRAMEVKGSYSETVGALKLIKAKDISVSCGTSYTVNAAGNIVTCGGSRNDSAGAALSITSGGGLSVKAKSITIEAKNTLVMMFGACMFRLAKAGKVVIKAATVDLKGAKSLGQVNHGSN